MTAAAFRLALAGTASGAPLGGLAASLLPPHALDGINTDLADRYYWERSGRTSCRRSSRPTWRRSSRPCRT